MRDGPETEFARVHCAHTHEHNSRENTHYQLTFHHVAIEVDLYARCNFKKVHQVWQQSKRYAYIGFRGYRDEKLKQEPLLVRS